MGVNLIDGVSCSFSKVEFALLLLLLPLIHNLEEYLNGVRILLGENEDNSVTFTRAKIVDVYFGHWRKPQDKSDLPT